MILKWQYPPEAPSICSCLFLTDPNTEHQVYEVQQECHVDPAVFLFYPMTITLKTIGSSCPTPAVFMHFILRHNNCIKNRNICESTGWDLGLPPPTWVSKSLSYRIGIHVAYSFFLAPWLLCYWKHSGCGSAAGVENTLVYTSVLFIGLGTFFICGICGFEFHGTLISSSLETRAQLCSSDSGA